MQPNKPIRGLPWRLAVKDPPAIQETWVPPLGWGDALEKGLATRLTSLGDTVHQTAQQAVAGSSPSLSLLVPAPCPWAVPGLLLSLGRARVALGAGLALLGRRGQMSACLLPLIVW